MVRTDHPKVFTYDIHVLPLIVASILWIKWQGYVYRHLILLANDTYKSYIRRVFDVLAAGVNNSVRDIFIPCSITDPHSQVTRPTDKCAAERYALSNQTLFWNSQGIIKLSTTRRRILEELTEQSNIRREATNRIHWQGRYSGRPIFSEQPK